MFRQFGFLVVLSLVPLAGPASAATLAPDFSAYDRATDLPTKDDLFLVLAEQGTAPATRQASQSAPPGALEKLALLYGLTVLSLVIARNVPGPRRSTI